MIHHSATSSLPGIRATVLLLTAISLAACSSAPTIASTPSSTTTRPTPSTTEATATGVASPTPPLTTTSSSEGGGCVGALDGPTTIAYRQLSGIDPSLLSLDVYRRPGASGCPVIIWIHGGGWALGDKAGKGITTKVAWAGELGAVLVSINYRLARPANDVRWPDFGEDTAAAVSWVLDHAGELGADPHRVAIIGHSAGAHLATIVTTNPGLLGRDGHQRNDLACVVALDTASYDLHARIDDRDSGEELVENAFAGDQATLDDGSPLIQVRTHPGPLPAYLLVTRGDPARQRATQEMASALDEAGTSASIVVATGLTHEQVNVDLGRPDDQVVTPPVERFLSGCIGTPPALSPAAVP